MTNTVDFWFDATCPWTWITSRWLTEVAEARDLAITWRPSSLAIINEKADLSDNMRAHVERGRESAEVAMKIAENEGNAKLGEFYTAYGTMIHNGGQRVGGETLDAALEKVGLGAGYREGAHEYDERVHESVAAAQEAVGNDVGVPVISIDDVAFFGPVLSPAPHGQAALDLWDGCLALAKMPGFFELKRSRDVDPIFD